MDEATVKLVQLLLTRLEHISADSVCAHRASGIRGSLFRALESLENGEIVPRSRLEALISSGFSILEYVFKENFKQKPLTNSAFDAGQAMVKQFTIIEKSAPEKGY